VRSRSIVILLVIVAAFAIAPPVAAAPMTWFLTATFDDGAALDAQFTFDSEVGVNGDFFLAENQDSHFDSDGIATYPSATFPFVLLYSVPGPHPTVVQSGMSVGPAQAQFAYTLNGLDLGLLRLNFSAELTNDISVGNSNPIEVLSTSFETRQRISDTTGELVIDRRAIVSGTLINAIPEPASALLFGAGIGVAGFSMRRRTN